MTTAALSVLPHLLSLLRPALGAGILAATPAPESWVMLSLVLLACASDWLDGEAARRIGSQTRTGRIVDNLCDFFFLICVFEFFALVELWSPPGQGLLVAHLPAANGLPVLALAASFGVYFVRLLREFAAGRDPQRSPRGHAAGVCNYALAIAGAVEMLPRVSLGPWLLEALMLLVVLLNFAAVAENLSLMFHRPRPEPRMPA